MTRPMRFAIYLLFLLSGATALVYQVTWVRDLTLIFGASFQATSIVLASFMAGLCLGGFLFGRYSERVLRPLRVYGILELGIGGFALALPSLLRLADAIYVDAALAAGAVTPALTFVRVALAFAILVLPTLLMGATLPVLTRALVDRYAEFGTGLSWLYGINTLGAVVGAVAAGFFLIPFLGVWHSQLLAVAVNSAIGVLAIAVGWRRHRLADPLPRPRSATETPPEPAGEPAASGPALEPRDRLGAQLAYRGVAVTGMCALALEVMWTRAISISVGTTTYSFTVMLASFLVGIWLGSWLHALVPLRRVRPHVQFCVVMSIIGLTSVLASYWIPRLPTLVLELNVALYGLQARILPGAALLAGFVVMLIPCIFMGISFPLAGQARASLGPGFGRSAGDTLGWNTLGSIVGSLLAGFVLIPLIGLQRGMLLVAGVYLAYALLLLSVTLFARSVLLRGVTAAATAIAAAAALSLPWWVPPWDVRTMGGFENNQLPRYVTARGDVEVRSRLENEVVVYYREGQASTVSVAERQPGRALLVNGKAVAADTFGDIAIQYMLGHVPVLAHPDPKTALVIGLGAGFTLGSVTAHPRLREITLVEIEPAVVDAQPAFAAVNGNPLADPRMRVHLQDGRNYLKTNGQRFDVITADPIHPWNQGSAYLFTSEYYAIAKARLEDGGIMCQWLPTYGLSVENFKSIVATFRSVFPHAILWQYGAETVIIGSETPIRIDFEDLASRLAQPAVAEQLGFIGLDDPFAFLAEAAMDTEACRDYAEGGIINTDDNLYLEFASPLNIGTRESVETILTLNSYRSRPWEDSGLLSASAAQREGVERSREAKRKSLLIEHAASGWEKIGRLRRLLEEAPGFGPARRLLSIQLTSRGYLQLNRGQLASAERSLREAVALQPVNWDAQLALGITLRQLDRFQESIASLQRALELRPNRWRSHVQLSQSLAAAGRVPEAVESLRSAIAINPTDPALNEQLRRLTQEL